MQNVPSLSPGFSPCSHPACCPGVPYSSYPNHSDKKKKSRSYGLFSSKVLHTTGFYYFFIDFINFRCIQQDNDPKHTSGTSYKGEKKGNSDLKLMKLVRDKLDRKVKAKQLSTARHTCVLSVGKNLLTERYLLPLIERMP